MRAPLAAKIPLAVLAGILFKVGTDIVDWRFLRHVAGAPRADVIIMCVVMAVTVLVDLITAVGVGVVLASVLFVKRMAEQELASLTVITHESEESPLTADEQAIMRALPGRIALIHVGGPMSFGSAKEMVRRLESTGEIRKSGCVVLDLADVPMMDGTAAMAVEDMVRITEHNQQHVLMAGVTGPVKAALEGMGVLKLVPPSHCHANRREALEHAARLASSGNDSAVALVRAVPAQA